MAASGNLVTQIIAAELLVKAMWLTIIDDRIFELSLVL